MRYGADRGRFHEVSGKRAVEDKNIGPLIKVGTLTSIFGFDINDKTDFDESMHPLYALHKICE